MNARNSTVVHPLEPLSAEEVVAAVDLLRQQQRLNSGN